MNPEQTDKQVNPPLPPPVEGTGVQVGPPPSTQPTIRVQSHGSALVPGDVRMSSATALLHAVGTQLLEIGRTVTERRELDAPTLSYLVDDVYKLLPIEGGRAGNGRGENLQILRRNESRRGESVLPLREGVGGVRFQTFRCTSMGTSGTISLF